MTDWQRMKLGDLCPFVYGKSLPSTVRDEAGVISVYGSNGVVGKHSEACVFEPGVIVGRKGSVGEVHFSAANFWPIDTAFYVVGSSKCDVGFAYYLLKSLDLKSMNSDSAIPGLNRDAAHSLNVSVPPLAEQRAISEVLGALDDKIESNRRIQNLLEFESQVLYERYYEYDSESSSCREVKLAELADINPPRQLKKGSIAKYVEMSSLPTKNALIEHWEEREVGSGQKFLNGDTLVARITPCLENGKGAFVDFLDENEVAWGSTEYIVLRPHEPLPSPWAYCLSRTTRFRDFAIRHMNGSSGRQRCDASALREYLVRVAPEGLTNEFTKSVTKNFERMGLARDENHALEKLRDALLPELLSGRLRVKDAESMMENV